MSRILLLVAAAACCAAAPPDPKKAPPLPESWYSAGTSRPDSAGFGFTPSRHLPVKLKNPGAFTAGELSLKVVHTKAVEPGEKAQTLLWVANRTKGDAWLAACDSRIYLVMEKKTKAGKWEAVEAMPTTFCGNSLHRVAAGPGEGWSFPVLTDDRPKHTLRYQLLPDGPHAGKGARAAIVSNEFEGSPPTAPKPPGK